MDDLASKTNSKNPNDYVTTLDRAYCFCDFTTLDIKMHLLNYRENKQRIEYLYQKQYNLDLSTIVEGYNWYSLVLGDIIVAECSVSINDCGYFQIDDVEVSPFYRGNGYCQAIVKMVIDNLLMKAAKGVSIISDPSTAQDSCYKNVFTWFSNNGQEVVTFKDNDTNQIYRMIKF